MRWDQLAKEKVIKGPLQRAGPKGAIMVLVKLLQAGSPVTSSAALLNSGTETGWSELKCVQHSCAHSKRNSKSSKEGIKPCWGRPRKCWDLLFWLETRKSPEYLTQTYLKTAFRRVYREPTITVFIQSQMAWYKFYSFLGSVLYILLSILSFLPPLALLMSMVHFPVPPTPQCCTELAASSTSSLSCLESSLPRSAWDSLLLN